MTWNTVHTEAARAVCLPRAPMELDVIEPLDPVDSQEYVALTIRVSEFAPIDVKIGKSAVN